MVFSKIAAALRYPGIDHRRQGRAMRRVEQLTALGAAVSSLEYLASMRNFDRGQLLDWQTARTRYRWMSGKPGKVLDVLFDKRGMQTIFTLRVIAAGALMAPGTSRGVRTSAATFLAATNFAVAARSPYGSDGSETILNISLSSIALSRMLGDDPRAREACLWFIALQSSFSYGIAGAAKAISPVWRDGTAIRDIFRTRIFGQKHVFAFVKDKPHLARALGIVTIVGETAFPLVVVAPPKMAKAILAVGGSFHIGNAFVMGLNRFVWAFLGTYPAVEYCRLGRRELT